MTDLDALSLAADTLTTRLRNTPRWRLAMRWYLQRRRSRATTRLERALEAGEHCQTPGALYQIEIRRNVVKVTVTLPDDIQPNGEQAAQLEAQLHVGVESVLSTLWP